MKKTGLCKAGKENPNFLLYMLEQALFGQQLAIGELPNYVSVSVEEVEAGKLLSFNPTNLLEDLILDFTFVLFYVVKVQRYRSALFVVMLG